ncbi:MAG: PTS sugar transporter [bacterium]|nr:MAG: PTS sugar transporter [bacterium]
MVENRIGIVLVTHGELGHAMVETSSLIIGDLKNVTSVSVRASDAVEEVRDLIERAIDRVRGSEGTILLVDMFGGTPSNISLSFLADEGIEVVTGVNLPMLTKLATLDPNLKLAQAAGVLRDYGKEHIKVAADYLSEK